MYRRRISPRKLAVLVDFLPPESATHTALRNAAPEGSGDAAEYDAAKARWSSEEMLLAGVLDAVNRLTWVYGTAHGAKSPAPAPLRRPGAGPVRHRSRLTPEQRRRLDPRLRTGQQEDDTA